MNTKKVKRSKFRGMLFVYLAISKIFYWYAIIINALNQGDLWAAGEAILLRLLNQDIPIILSIFIMVGIEEFIQLKLPKFNKILNLIIVPAIAYLLFIGILITYYRVMASLFGLFENMNLGENIIYISVGFFVVVVILEIKLYFKKKEMTEYTVVLNEDEKLIVLKTLLNNNVLTQDEYDRKKEELLRQQKEC